MCRRQTARAAALQVTGAARRSGTGRSMVAGEALSSRASGFGPGVVSAEAATCADVAAFAADADVTSRSSEPSLVIGVVARRSIHPRSAGTIHARIGSSAVRSAGVQGRTTASTSAARATRPTSASRSSRTAGTILHTRVTRAVHPARSAFCAAIRRPIGRRVASQNGWIHQRTERLRLGVGPALRASPKHDEKGGRRATSHPRSTAPSDHAALAKARCRRLGGIRESAAKAAVPEG